MKSIISILLLCVALSAAHAQNISRNYQKKSMSDVLIDLDHASSRYKVAFIYNELEDFTVTKHISAHTIPAAITQAIGFYPITMTVGDSLITVECMSKEQNKLIGRVVDSQAQPVPFTNIQLLNPADSAFITGGVTNENGDFVIPCAAPRVIARFTCIGYQTRCIVTSPRKIGTIRLAIETHFVKGVTVKGRQKTDYIDHAVYTFTQEQQRNARQTQEILAALPDLRIDPLSGKLATLSGKTFKILVNGVPASDNDLKMIPVNKIRNVEYYTVPPARYADVGTLINIHTRPLDEGYAAGFDMHQALTSGFDDTNAYYKYNKGNHQVSLDYALSYRNHDDCMNYDDFTFIKDNNRSSYHYEQNYHFGYANNDINLKYLYSPNDSTLFQAKFTPNINTWFWRGNNTVKAENSPAWKDGEAWQDKRTRSFGPSLDLYFDKKLNHDQSITVDLLGTYYHNNDHAVNRQTVLPVMPDGQTGTEEMLLDDDMRQKNDKYSIIAEGAYTKKMKGIDLSAGYKMTLAKSDYRISNVFSDYKEYSYHSSNDNHYVYAQMGGRLKKLSYRMSLGGTYVSTRNDEAHFNKMLFTPQLLLSYPIKNGMLQFKVQSEPTIPSISQLSNNSTVTIPGLINLGNPQLRAGNDNTAMLSFSYSNSYLDIYTHVAAEYLTNPICTTYKWSKLNGEDVVTTKPQNFTNEKLFTATCNLTLRPFGNDMLSLDLSATAQHDTYSSREFGTRRHWYTPLAWQVQFHKGHWTALWDGRIVSKQFNGMSLLTDENDSDIGIVYRHKQLQLGMYCVFFLTTPHYYTNTIDNGIMDYKHFNELPQQSNMLIMTVSYNIFSGKQKDIKKKINNRDYDKGI